MPVPQTALALILNSAKTASLVDRDNITNKSASNSVKSAWEIGFSSDNILALRSRTRESPLLVDLSRFGI